MPNDESTVLRTPLYDLHVELGGKMVPFAGYALPVHYPTGIIREHNHTREAAGLCLRESTAYSAVNPTPSVLKNQGCFSRSTRSKHLRCIRCFGRPRTVGATSRSNPRRNREARTHRGFDWSGRLENREAPTPVTRERSEDAPPARCVGCRWGAVT